MPQVRGSNTETPVFYGVKAGGWDRKQVSVKKSKPVFRCVSKEEVESTSGSETMQRLKD